MEKKIKLGECFDSYEEFVEILNTYCKTEYVSYYKREARTVLAARKKTGRYLNPKLKYYQLKYACIKGGKEFKSSGKGNRNTSTYKDGCSAHITLRASHCGNYLQIFSITTKHNHYISKQLYDRLPQQRRLPEDIQSEIIHIEKLKTKRKQSKRYVEEISNKIVLLKDLSSNAKKSNPPDMTLSSIIQILQSKYETDCQVLSDEENNFKALFFQTEIMKHYMSVYPEFLCIDTTFKLLDISKPIMIMMNEDGNGFSEIVAVAILVKESTDSIQWFFSKFKENNPRWKEVYSIMVDKDLNKRRLLTENFPKAKVSIRIFHAMKKFNRDISTKFGISLTERETALEIFQKMFNSRDPVTYNNYFESLLESCSLKVIEYFNNNWHSIRDEWTLGSNFQQSNFLNTTNNRLESLNVKIKSLVERYSSLSDFIDNFFQLIMLLSDERDHKVANLMYKVPICFYVKDSTLDKYFKFLTNYAFDFVNNQLLTKKLNNKYETTAEFCNCESRTSMMLPCRHIFQKREELGMDTYVESLCHDRWTRTHYYCNQQLFLSCNQPIEQNHDVLESPVNNHTVAKSVSLNQQQKFVKAWVLLKSLAGLISVEDNSRYHTKLRQLIQLKSVWENNKNITIIEQDEEMANEMNAFTGKIEDIQEDFELFESKPVL